MSDNLAVIGLQWGDEGKGKIVDYLSKGYDAVARYSGGSNAGHTVVTEQGSFTFHLLPSGVISNKELLIASGVVVDPEVLKKELAIASRDKVLIDNKCSVVTPFEKELDKYIEKIRGAMPIGTTRRGIGPAYALRALRLSPRAMDLFSPHYDIQAFVEFYRALGIRTNKFNEWMDDARKTLTGLLGDVAKRVKEMNEAGKRILFEGSQGTLLDILHGSYPFVTSSHTTASYIAASIGINPLSAGSVLGVAKCYTTRVGSGPFPSEMDENLAARVREIGKEYGATTGRPRRIGWLDLVGLKYAIALNGANVIALSKLDVLTQLKEIKICTSYMIDGSETQDFSKALPRLSEAKPVYDSFKPISGYDFKAGLCGALAELVDYIQNRLKVKISLLSYGAERSKIIEL